MLTKELAIQFHRETWHRCPQSNVEKHEIAQRLIDHYNLEYEGIYNDCFLCQYVIEQKKSAELRRKDCVKYCPLDWGSETCEDHGTAFFNWRRSPSSYNCMEIANLREKKGRRLTLKQTIDFYREVWSMNPMNEKEKAEFTESVANEHGFSNIENGCFACQYALEQSGKSSINMNSYDCMKHCPFQWGSASFCNAEGSPYYSWINNYPKDKYAKQVKEIPLKESFYVCENCGQRLSVLETRLNYELGDHRFRNITECKCDHCGRRQDSKAVLNEEYVNFPFKDKLDLTQVIKHLEEGKKINAIKVLKNDIGIKINIRSAKYFVDDLTKWLELNKTKDGTKWFVTSLDRNNHIGTEMFYGKEDKLTFDLIHQIERAIDAKVLSIVKIEEE